MKSLQQGFVLLVLVLLSACDMNNANTDNSSMLIYSAGWRPTVKQGQHYNKQTNNNTDTLPQQQDKKAKQEFHYYLEKPLRNFEWRDPALFIPQGAIKTPFKVFIDSIEIYSSFIGDGFIPARKNPGAIHIIPLESNSLGKAIIISFISKQIMPSGFSSEIYVGSQKQINRHINLLDLPYWLLAGVFLGIAIFGFFFTATIFRKPIALYSSILSFLYGVQIVFETKNIWLLFYNVELVWLIYIVMFTLSSVFVLFIAQNVISIQSKLPTRYIVITVATGAAILLGFHLLNVISYTIFYYIFFTLLLIGYCLILFDTLRIAYRKYYAALISAIGLLIFAAFSFHDFLFSIGINVIGSTMLYGLGALLLAGSYWLIVVLQER